MDWFYLALLTPLLWSVVVFIDDNMLQRIYKGPHLGALISGLFGAIPLVSLFWLDTGSISTLHTLLAIAAGFLTVVYYYYYFKALERESPSVVIALFSLTPATIPLFAYFLLGESLTSLQILGFIIVLCASFSLAATDVRKFKFSKATMPVLIAALIFDAISLMSKYVYENTNFYTGYIFFALGMGLGGLYYLYTLIFMRKGHDVKELLRKNSFKLLVVLAAAEAINIAAEFLQNLALSRGPVSLVKAIANVQPVYMLIIAFVLYPFFPKFFREAGEGGLRIKLLLIVLIIIGVSITLL